MHYVFKKFLFKTINIFTSNYFEPHCKIHAWSNKSVLKSFYHKIDLHVKGILSQNKQIELRADQALFSLRVGNQANAWNDINTAMLTKAQLLLHCPKTSEK